MDHRPTYSITDKPTLRNSGTMMYDMYVKHAVGIDEIAFAIYNEFDNKISKEGRRDILQAVAKNLTFTAFNDGSWADALEEEVEEAYRLARKLFPELNNEKASACT